MSDKNSKNVTDDDKMTLAIETLSNMTDFISFKNTMLAKQAESDINNGGNF